VISPTSGRRSQSRFTCSTTSATARAFAKCGKDRDFDHLAGLCTAVMQVIEERSNDYSVSFYRDSDTVRGFCDAVKFSTLGRRVAPIRSGVRLLVRMAKVAAMAIDTETSQAVDANAAKDAAAPSLKIIRRAVPQTRVGSDEG
jgi:hypothetical protein